jgi:hypothetical protein
MKRRLNLELVSLEVEVSAEAVVLIELITEIRSLLALQRKPLPAPERRFLDAWTAAAALSGGCTSPTGSMPADMAGEDSVDDFGVVPRFRRSALL